MRSYVFILLSSLCFASIGIFIDFLPSTSNVFAVSFHRVFWGFAFTALLMPFFGWRDIKPSKEDLKHYTIMGAILALGVCLFSAANLLAPVANAYLFDSAFVLIVPLLAYLFLKEKLTKREAVVLCIGVLGLLVMKPLQSEFAPGNLFALADAFMFASLITYMRFAERDHDFGFFFWVTLVSSILLLPSYLLTFEGLFVAHPLVLILLGAIGTGLAYTLMASGLKGMTSDSASLIMFIASPVFSILMAAAIFGEIPGFNVVLGGGILLLAGVLLEIPKPKVH